MTKLEELIAIDQKLQDWSSRPWSGTVKAVIMFLLTRRRQLTKGGVKWN